MPSYDHTIHIADGRPESSAKRYLKRALSKAPPSLWYGFGQSSYFMGEVGHGIHGIAHHNNDGLRWMGNKIGCNGFNNTRINANSSSRVIPGFLGIPEVITQIWLPAVLE